MGAYHPSIPYHGCLPTSLPYHWCIPTPHFRRSGKGRPRRQSGKARQGKSSGRELCFISLFRTLANEANSERRNIQQESSVLMFGFLKWTGVESSCSNFVQGPRAPSLDNENWEAKYHISQNTFSSHPVFLFQPTGFSHGTDGGSCLDIEIQFPKYRNTVSQI